MGQVADILTSPEWASKSDVEKARAQRDLFQISLRDNPDYAAQFNAADDTGKQKLVDDWKAQVRQSYPDAFATTGTVWSQQEDSKGLLYPHRVPVQIGDVTTEEYIDKLKHDPAALKDAVDAANKIEDPEQKNQMQTLLALRLEAGNIPDSLISTDKPGRVLGRMLADGQPDPTDWRNYPVLLPAALRTGGAIAGTVLGATAGAETGPGAVAAGAAGRAAGGFIGDLAAQQVEKAMGTRDQYSKGEAAINTIISALPPIPLPEGASALLRAGARGVEGAAIGAGQEAAMEAVHGDKLSLPNIATAGAAGLGLGGLIGAFEPKIAAMVAGKSREDAIATLQSAAAGANPVDRAALTAAQRQIEESLRIGEPQNLTAPQSATTLSAEHPPVVKPASDSAAVLSQGLADQQMRADDFVKAKAEANAQDAAAALESAKAGQLGGQESTALGEDPIKNQLTVLDTRPGDAAAERARLDAQLQEIAPKVEDSSVSPNVQLSPQAQAIYDQYGFISPRLAASLGGGSAGFAYGASRDPEGDTAQERAVNRIKNGLAMAVVGAAGGYMFGTRFLSGDRSSPAQPGSVLAEVDNVLKKPTLPSFASKVAAIPGNLRTAFITRYAPLDQLEKNVLEAAGNAAPEVTTMARHFEQVAGAGGKALVDVKDFERAVLPAVQGNERDFDRLLFLKRTGQRMQQDAADAIDAARIQAISPAQRTPDEAAFMQSYVPDRRRVADWTLPKVDAGLAELEQALGSKRFAELDQTAAGAFQQEMDRSLQLQVSSGRISQEAYNAIKASNDFYAPFRVLRTLEEIDAGHVVPGIDTRQQIVNAIRGIDDQEFHIDSPTKAAAENIFNGRVLAEKNQKMLKLADLADEDPSGTFIKKLASWAKPRKGFEAVNYFEDGVPKRLEVAPEVAEAIKGLTPGESGLAVKFAQKMGGAFRFGATSANLAFQVRNIAFADQPRLMLMSKYGFNAGDVINPLRVPMDFTSALLSSIKSNVFGAEDDLARQFYASGAAGSTLQDSISHIGGRFTPGSAADKGAGVVRDVIDKFEDVTRVLEETTKMMGFKRGLRIEGIAKLPPDQAAAKLEDIVTEVRNFAGSPDFARGGSVAKDLSMMTLFFNARVQGGASDISRLAGGDGAKTALKAWTRIGATVGVASTYFWYLNHSPENEADYAKVPSWERDNYMMVPRYAEDGSPLYFTNAQGDKVREYWRIPKRESVQTIANLTESALDFAKSKDPAAVAQFGVNLGENLSPINISGKTGSERVESALSGLNPVVKVPLEVSNNRDYFRHRDIVPQSRQGGSPENQFYAGGTPQGYVDAARAMPQIVWDPLRSPLMLQHVVGGFTGGLVNQFAGEKPRAGTRDATTAALAANPIGHVFVRSTQNDNSAAEADVAAAKTAVRDRQIQLSNAASSELDKVAALPPDQRAPYLTSLAAKDPKIIEAIANEADKRAKGFNTVDRVAVTLPIESGERAAFIFGQLTKLSPQERAAYLADQVKKEIVTQAVLEQIAERMGASRN